MLHPIFCPCAEDIFSSSAPTPSQLHIQTVLPEERSEHHAFWTSSLYSSSLYFSLFSFLKAVRPHRIQLTPTPSRTGHRICTRISHHCPAREPKTRPQCSAPTKEAVEPILYYSTCTCRQPLPQVSHRRNLSRQPSPSKTQLSPIMAAPTQTDLPNGQGRSGILPGSSAGTNVRADPAPTAERPPDQTQAELGTVEQDGEQPVEGMSSPLA